MKCILIVSLLALAPPSPARPVGGLPAPAAPAPQGSDCWCMPGPDSANGFYVIDSTGRYDTCGLDFYPRSCTYAVRFSGLAGQRIYCKGDWRVWFSMDAIKLPAAKPDSILDLDWRAIDTSYPSVRTGFARIEARFGTFVLRKREPQETTGWGSRQFTMIFPQYHNGDSIQRAVTNIDSTSCELDGPFRWLLIAVHGDADPTAPLRPAITIAPNPARDLIHVGGAESYAHAGWRVVDLLGRVRGLLRRIGDGTSSSRISKPASTQSSSTSGASGGL